MPKHASCRAQQDPSLESPPLPPHSLWTEAATYPLAKGAGGAVLTCWTWRALQKGGREAGMNSRAKQPH